MTEREANYDGKNIDIREDKSERVKYDLVGFPAYIRKGFLSYFPNYTALSHWHDDIELIAVLSGKMDYNINGENVVLQEGEGIFINVRHLHYGFAKDKVECVYICVLLHPMLLCSTKYMDQKFVEPVITNANVPYCILRGTVDWQKNVLNNIIKMYECSLEQVAELKIQSLFFSLWAELYGHLGVSKKAIPARNYKLSILKDMIAYIQRHYQEKITLNDICEAGNVGRTSCSAIFKKYVNRTPGEYLTDYRLNKSIELMQTTDMTITEICYEVGFAGASYFTETFHKNFGCTPTEYRKGEKIVWQQQI